VYNNLFPALTQNLFVVGNTIRGSTRYALTTGSNVGANGTQPSSAVSFFGNVIDATNAIGAHANGAQDSTLYVGNADAAGFSMSALAARGSVLAPDPLGRARAVPPSAAATRSRTPSATGAPGATGSDAPVTTPSGPPSVSPAGSPTGSPTGSGTAPLAAPCGGGGGGGGGAAASGGAPPLVGDPTGAALWGTVGFALGCAVTAVAAATVAARRRRAAGAGLVKPPHPALPARQARSSVRGVLGANRRV
jgi:hypothetical protein